AQQEMVELHNGNFEKATGITKLYYTTLFVAIQHPWKVLLSAVLLAGGVGFTYSKAGLGAEFFPEVDPPFFTVKVRSY
ncbi:hypothetical protein OFN60_42630, partial [Escherichia coli]|nr:hypothetical protein [Escherichia coli]